MQAEGVPPTDSPVVRGAASELYSVNRQNTRWRIVDGETVVINLESTHYYSLNKTGTFVWTFLLEGERSLGEVATAVATHYCQPLQAVLFDVRAVIHELAREALVVMRSLPDEKRTEDA